MRRKYIHRYVVVPFIPTKLLWYLKIDIATSELNLVEIRQSTGFEAPKLRLIQVRYIQ